MTAVDDKDGGSPPWAELPADAVSEIAGHLHEPTAFVRFHAVCKPWREAHNPRSTSSFLPCLIEQTLFSDSAITLHLHSPFFPGHTGTIILPALNDRKIRSCDKSSGRVLAVGVQPQWPYHGQQPKVPLLIHPLTGDTTALPPLPAEDIRFRRPECPTGGIIATDGAVVLFYSDMRFVLLRPGGLTGWKAVDLRNTTAFPEEIMDIIRDDWNQDKHTRRAVILLCSSSTVLLRGGGGAMAKLPETNPRTTRRYVLESAQGGELLCLDVPTPVETTALTLSVAVHVLGVRNDGTPQWVEREHGIDEHECLFLNPDGSGLAVDVREFGGAEEVTGGCAYFVDSDPMQTMKDAVYRYSFQDGTVTVVDELPLGFGVTCMWYRPTRPRISAATRSSSSRLKKRGNDDVYNNSQQPVRSRPRLQPPPVVN